MPEQRDDLEQLARIVLAAIACCEPRPSAAGLLALLCGLRAAAGDCAREQAGGRLREGSHEFLDSLGDVSSGARRE